MDCPRPGKEDAMTLLVALEEQMQPPGPRIGWAPVVLFELLDQDT